MRLQLPAAVNMIIDVLQAHGYEGFAVGGCVRDSVLNRTPDDWDITTSATPYQQLQGQFQILHSLFRTIQQFSESRILCTLPLLRHLQVKFYHRSRQIVNGFL